MARGSRGIGSIGAGQPNRHRIRASRRGLTVSRWLAVQEELAEMRRQLAELRDRIQAKDDRIEAAEVRPCLVWRRRQPAIHIGAGPDYGAAPNHGRDC
jgi:hypothetical protein